MWRGLGEFVALHKQRSLMSGVCGFNDGALECLCMCDVRVGAWAMRWRQCRGSLHLLLRCACKHKVRSTPAFPPEVGNGAGGASRSRR